MNLLRAASVVSLFTLLSRVFGLAREVVVASMFGAGADVDAFNVAFRIPNLLRRLFGEGAFVQAFGPVLGETREVEGEAATRRLIDAVATVLLWALVATIVIGVIGAPVIVWLIGSGLARIDEATVMTRWMFPYIGFVSLVSLAGAVLNTWRRFAVSAATPVLLNLSQIAMAWLLAPAFGRWGWPPIYALAVGVMLGGVLQLAVQLPALARIGVLPRVGLTWPALRRARVHPGVVRVLRQMGPVLIGVSVAPISIMINTQIASRQGVGAVSWISYADRLMEFPTALIGVALGIVLIPQLSKAQAKSDRAGYSGLVDWGLRLVLLLALPCTMALLVFSDAMVATLFQRGAFTAESVPQTARALFGYGVGLIGIVAVKVLAPGFYARQDARTPVKIAVGVLALTQLLNLAFVPLFQHAGLTLSISVAALVNATFLFIGLYRAGWYRPEPGWAVFATRVVWSSVALGAWLAWAAHAVDWQGLVGHDGRRAGLMSLCLLVAVALYGGALALTGLRLRDFIRRD